MIGPPVIKAIGKTLKNKGYIIKAKINEKTKLIVKVLLKNAQYNFNLLMVCFSLIGADES